MILNSGNGYGVLYPQQLRLILHYLVTVNEGNSLFWILTSCSLLTVIHIVLGPQSDEERTCTHHISHSYPHDLYYLLFLPSCTIFISALCLFCLLPIATGLPRSSPPLSCRHPTSLSFIAIPRFLWQYFTLRYLLPV